MASDLDQNRLIATIRRLVQAIDRKLNTYQTVITETIILVDDRYATDYFVLDEDDNLLYTEKKVAIGDTSIPPSTDFYVKGNVLLDSNIVSIGTDPLVPSIITIGHSGSSITLAGNVSLPPTSVDIKNDKLVTVNQLNGNLVGSATSSGFQIRDGTNDGAGYFKTDGTTATSFQFKAPAAAGIVTLDTGTMPASIVLTEYNQLINGRKTFSEPITITDTTAAADINTAALICYGGAYFGGNAIVKGDVLIEGNLLAVNAEQINIKDNVILLNSSPAMSMVDTGVSMARFQNENNTGSGDVVNDASFQSDNIVSADATSFVVPNTYSSNPDHYVDAYVKITNNSPSGALNQVRRIAAFNPLTWRCTLSTPWNVVPNSSTTYSLHGRNFVGVVLNEATDRMQLAAASKNAITTFPTREFVDLELGRLFVESTTEALSVGNAAASIKGGLAVGKSLLLEGDATVNKRLFVQDSTVATTPATSSIYSNGSIGAANNLNVGAELRVGADSFFAGKAVVSSGAADSIGTMGGIQATGTVQAGALQAASAQITGLTASTSSTTGALVVSGGVGVAEALFVGASATANGLISSSVVNATSPTNPAAIATPGGLAVAQDVHIGGGLFVNTLAPTTLVVQGTTDIVPNNLTTGSFSTKGGASIEKSMNIGDTLYANEIALQSLTNATSITTGGFRTKSGGSFEQDLFVGGKVNANNLQLLSVAADSINTAGGIQAGPASFTSITSSGKISSTSTAADSISTTGGMGVSKGLEVGEAALFNGSVAIDDTTASLSHTSGALVVKGGVGVYQDLNVNGNVSITGDLNVSGKTNIVQVDITEYATNLLVLNNDNVSASKDSGLLLERFQVANDVGSGDIVQGPATLKGTVLSATATTLVVDTIDLDSPTALNPAVDFYKNWWLRITNNSPPGALNQVRKVVASGAGSFTIQSAWTVEPDGTSTFSAYGELASTVFYDETADRFRFGYSSTVPPSVAVDVVRSAPVLCASLESDSTSATSIKSAGGVQAAGLLDASSGVFQTTLQVKGATTIDSTLEVKSAATLASAEVSGNTKTGSLEVVSTSTFDGAAEFKGKVHVSNTSPPVSAANSALGVSGGLFVAGSAELAGVRVNDTTEATSATTGALRVSGGIASIKGVWAGGDLTVQGAAQLQSTKVLDASESTSISTGALVVDGGVGIAKNMYVGGLVRATSTTDSSSVSTGALAVSGGVGIAKNVYIGGKAELLDVLNVQGATTLSAAIASTSTTTGGLVVVGGVGMGGNLHIGGNLIGGGTGSFAGAVSVLDTTQSTTTATGSFIAAGGAGIAKNLYIGGLLNAAGAATLQSTLNVNGIATLSNNVNVGNELDVGGAAQFDSTINVGSNTESVSTLTGALVVSGGIGAAGNINIGKQLKVLGNTVLGTDDTNSTTVSGPLQLVSKTTLEKVSVRAPDAMGASYTLVLPSDDGAAGQALTTDGSGVLSWDGPFQAATAGLTNFDANNAVGILVQTSADNFASRTLQGTANQVLVANGDGAAGNPVLSLPQDIATISSPSFASITLSSGGISSTGPASFVGGPYSVGGALDSAAISIGKQGSAARTIEIGTAAFANNIKLGSSLSVLEFQGATHTTTLSGTRTLSAGQYVYNGGDFDVNSTGVLSLDTVSTAISIGSAGASSGPLNIGTSTGARTISIGNTNGLTTVVLTAGDSISLVATGPASMSASTLSLDATAALELNSLGAISIGSDSNNQPITMGGAGVRTLTLGNAAATKVETKALQVQLTAGTTGLDAQSAGPITVGTTSSVDISIGKSGQTTTINGMLSVPGALAADGTKVQVLSDQLEIDDNFVINNFGASSARDFGYVSKRFQEANDTKQGAIVNNDEPVESGVSQGATSTSIILDPAANSTTVDFYKDWWLLITSNSGINQVRRIASYNEQNQTATVQSAFTTVPPVGSTYELFNRTFCGMVVDESRGRVVMGALAADPASTPIDPSVQPEPFHLQCRKLIIDEDCAADFEVSNEMGAEYALQLRNDSRYKVLANEFVTYSSARFKRKIESIPKEVARTIVGRLRPVSYKHRDGRSKEKLVGFIAEEVQEVFPPCVRHDRDGNPIGLNMNAIIPLLVATIQAQQEDHKRELQAIREEHRRELHTSLALLQQQIEDLRTILLRK